MNNEECKHEKFEMNCDITRDGDNPRWLMLATLKCRACGAQFYWGCDNLALFESGKPVDAITPSVNADCSQLRIFLSPVKPQLVIMEWGN